MSLDLDITGDVTVKCDRCLADLKIPVDIQVPFSVMFSSYAEDAEEGVSDEVILLDGSSSEIDLGQIIYDYVNLSLPIKKVHPRRDKRRTHDKLTLPALSTCSNCGATVLYHRVCPECGYYRGRLMVEKNVE